MQLFHYVAPLAATSLAEAQSPVSVQIDVLDSLYHVVQDAQIDIVEEDATIHSGVTGASGSARPFALDDGQIITVDVHGGQTSAGDTLAMRRAAILPANSAASGHVIGRSVPVLQPVYIGPSSEEPAQDALEQLGSAEHWLEEAQCRIPSDLQSFWHAPDVTYSFTVEVAALADLDDINGYFEIRGVSHDFSSYECGIVIRSDETHSIPFDEGLISRLWSYHHDFDGDVTAHSFFLPEDGPSSDAEASNMAVRGNFTLNDAAYVDVYGDIGAGDTVILVRDGAQAQLSALTIFDAWSLDAATPQPAPAGGPGTNRVGELRESRPSGAGEPGLIRPSASRSQEPCPPVPAPDAASGIACHGGAPEPVDSCSEAATELTTSCEHAVTERSGVLETNGMGQTLQDTYEWEEAHTGEIAALPFGVGGAYSYSWNKSHSTTVGVPSGAGEHGNGFACKLYSVFSTCRTIWLQVVNLAVVEEELVTESWHGTEIPVKRVTYTREIECGSVRFAATHCEVDSTTFPCCARTEP